MEEDMEIEQVFVVHEVDIDYEYDAPRFFDFTRDESRDESDELERWFESAKSHPPSPFAVKLLRGDNMLVGTVNVSPKSKYPNAEVFSGGCDGSKGRHQAIQASGIDRDGMAKGVFSNLGSGSFLEVPNQHLSKGSRFQNHKSSDKLKSNFCKDKPRSTLMKPTASMLAKQFQPSKVISSRLQKMPGQVNQRISVTLGSEGQSAKRQKLEKGHMCKPVEASQPTNLVHKAPKKDGIEKISHAKLRLTIPRGPDLLTAHRATRTRPQNNNQMEDVMISVRRFKARPLNRKILEAPQLPLPQKSTPKSPEFRLFHLKTLERATHSFSSVVPQSSVAQFDDSEKELFEANKALSVAEGRNKGAGRTTTADIQMQHGSQFLFKAHPPNRKMQVLSSKGGGGVFRNDKRGAAELKFQCDKRSQQIPPTELFSKLSLSSVKEETTNNGGCCQQLKSLQQHPYTHSKGSKENRCSYFPQKQTWMIEEKAPPVYKDGGRLHPKTTNTR